MRGGGSEETGSLRAVSLTGGSGIRSGEPNNFIPFLIFNRRLGLGEDLLIVVLTMSEEDLRSRLAFRHSGDESIQAIMMVWNLVQIFEINFSLNRKLQNFA